MFRLDTLGGLALLDPAGAPVPTPRLRLALLSLLAVAGARGLTRDKLVAYLWPESTPDNARHSLEQLLYSLRRQGPAGLVSGGDPLRLDPEVVAVDLWEFERHLAAGHRQGATALYRGPFLDGFFLGDAPEFEEWTATERSRLAAAYAGALYDMAKEAGSRGHHTGEIACLRQLTAVEPLSERVAAGLVRAFAAAGDWQSALEHARAWDATARRELGDGQPCMTALVERLRTEQVASPRADSTGARYTIVREIGRGSMATVYLARDAKLGRDVALKLLRPELAVSTAHERFHREIAILASLHHPHILEIHDSGVLDSGGRWKGPFFVMPFVAGESLRQRLDQEVQLPLEVVLRLGGEVAEALTYAHNRGIVHRDIKPENILLDSGHALLADFGVAYAVDQATGQSLSISGIRLGAPGYMSPEQAQGARVDARSDVYSLGCVVYEMLAGEPPFSGATAQAVTARHAVDPVPSLRTVRGDVSAALEGVVRTALAKSAGDRYDSAQAFADALRGAGGPGVG
jgi:DNA-binding SARP family transcriptional activator/tRNA A-37 threonylcarbamoyl transferase component Bud32